MRGGRMIVALLAVIALAWLSARWTGAQPAPESPGLDAVGRAVEAPADGLLGAGAAVGVLLLGSWMLGRLVKPLGLPMVTGYLLFGVLVGPGVLGLVTKQEIGYLTLINDLAVSLIALTAGGEIRFSFLRQAWRRIVTVALVEVLAVFVGVFALMLFVLPAVGIIDRSQTALLLAVSGVVATIATANSPAVVIAVITELRSRGPMSRLALTVTVCKDMGLVVLFTVALSLAVAAATSAEPAPGPEAVQPAAQADGAPPAPADSASADERGSIVKTLALHLGGSLVAGIVVGLLMSWYMHAIKAHVPLFVVFACFGIALLSEALHLEALLVAVVAGMLMENVWGELSEALFDHIEELSLPVYCVFFAVAGLKVNLESLADMWVWALVIVLVRAGLVWLGTWGGCRLSRAEPAVTRWGWTAFVPQAGVALALASIVEQSTKGFPFADRLYDLLLALIAIHQLVGPMLFRLGLVRAGETGNSGAGEGESAGH